MGGMGRTGESGRCEHALSTDVGPSLGPPKSHRTMAEVKTCLRGRDC